MKKMKILYNKEAYRLNFEVYECEVIQEEETIRRIASFETLQNAIDACYYYGNNNQNRRIELFTFDFRREE